MQLCSLLIWSSRSAEERSANQWGSLYWAEKVNFLIWVWNFCSLPANSDFFRSYMPWALVLRVLGALAEKYNQFRNATILKKISLYCSLLKWNLQAGTRVLVSEPDRERNSNDLRFLRVSRNFRLLCSLISGYNTRMWSWSQIGLENRKLLTVMYIISARGRSLFKCWRIVYRSRYMVILVILKIMSLW